MRQAAIHAVAQDGMAHAAEQSLTRRWVQAITRYQNGVEHGGGVEWRISRGRGCEGIVAWVERRTWWGTTGRSLCWCRRSLRSQCCSWHIGRLHAMEWGGVKRHDFTALFDTITAWVHCSSSFRNLPKSGPVLVNPPRGPWCWHSDTTGWREHCGARLYVWKRPRTCSCFYKWDFLWEYQYGAAWADRLQSRSNMQLLFRLRSECSKQECSYSVTAVDKIERTTPACWAAVGLVSVEPFLCGGLESDVIRGGAATGGNIDLHKCNPSPSKNSHIESCLLFTFGCCRKGL